MTEPASLPEGIDETGAARSRRNIALLLAGLIGAGITAGIIAGDLAPHHTAQARHHTSTAGLIGGLAALALVVALTVAALWWMFRRPGYRCIMQYGWRRRMRTVKALRRGRPIPPQDLPVASAIVELTRRQRWVPVFFVFLPVICLINGFDHRGFERWIQFAIAGVYVLVLPVLLRQRRLIGNYDTLVASAPQPPQRGPTSGHA